MSEKEDPEQLVDTHIFFPVSYYKYIKKECKRHHITMKAFILQLIDKYAKPDEFDDDGL